MKKSIIILSGLFILCISIIATLMAENTSGDTDLIFSHKKHMEEAGAECDACHSGAAESTKGTDDLLPKEEACLACHDKNDMGCKTCHKSGEKPVLLPRIENYSPMFNHAKHIEEGKKCLDCHSGIDRKESPVGRHLPDMNKCMTCHETPENIAGCYLCHNKDENLKPKDHNELWAVNHGSFKETSTNNCAVCHTENYCFKCHKGENLFNNSHPPEFIMTHSMSYIMKESNCSSCHEGLESCRECHTKLNYIKPANHAVNWNSLHKIEARMNYENCIVCHSDNDPTCMDCHRK
ncbi:MAG: hypothetical protein V1779_04815 [bacterium]